jgi:exodeoxyribonuclease-3
MLRIASWNVNSIKARLDIVTGWLANDHCDVLLMQETKSQDVNFPISAFDNIGWHVAFHGQKSYNGVAIASRHNIEQVTSGLAGDDSDEHARYMEATIGSIRVATIYLPNGNPAPGIKFDYKLAWLNRLEARAVELLRSEMPIVLGGDYNVIPDDEDCYDPAGWAGDALTRPESRAAFRRLLNHGYTDALRSLHPSKVFYTYWDYQAGAWQRDHGVRIDHFLLSPEALDRLESVIVDREPRGLEKPSDHTPIVCQLRY